MSDMTHELTAGFGFCIYSSVSESSVHDTASSVCRCYAVYCVVNLFSLQGRQTTRTSGPTLRWLGLWLGKFRSKSLSESNEGFADIIRVQAGMRHPSF